MANHASAKKRIIRNAKRADINTQRTSRLKTFLKKVMSAIESGDAKAAAAALQAAQPELDRGAAKGILHKNTVARKVSRLSARVKALAAG
ncbi:MAG: 30S ribosomal protein S20 [Pseudomonadota bacterium]